MRIVIDTNVVVSGVLWSGAPSEIIDLVVDGKVQAVVNTEIIEEYEEQIEHVASKVSKSYSKDFFDFLLSEFEVIPSISKIEVSRDPDDNKFLECAKDGHCIYIVSADKDLLVLEKYEDIEILTAAQFLARYRTKQVQNEKKKRHR